VVGLRDETNIDVEKRFCPECPPPVFAKQTADVLCPQLRNLGTSERKYSTTDCLDMTFINVPG
jgi:hypothetical protein